MAYHLIKILCKYSSQGLCISLHVKVIMGFPGGSNGKESACNVGDLGLEERNGFPLHYSYLENSMDRGACNVGTSYNVT